MKEQGVIAGPESDVQSGKAWCCARLSELVRDACKCRRKSAVICRDSAISLFRPSSYSFLEFPPGFACLRGAGVALAQNQVTESRTGGMKKGLMRQA